MLTPFLEVVRLQTSNPFGGVNAWPTRADEGPLQMQAENAVLPTRGGSRFDSAPHLGAGIGNQGRKARGRAELTVRSSDGAHRLRMGLIVEENTATAVDLQVDEPGRQKHTGRQSRPRPLGRHLSPRAKPNDPAPPDQHRGPTMPCPAIKQTVG
jgi:hypothetical protein